MVSAVGINLFAIREKLLVEDAGASKWSFKK